MNIISQTIQLLLAPPGGLVYHLLILFALEAVLGMALGAWRRRRAGEPDQVSVIFVAAVSGMLLVRLILIAVALAGLSGTYSANNLIPPLDRALNTAATALLVWALLPWGRSRDLSWLFLGLGLVGTALALALFLPAWQSDLAANPSLVYNGSWQEAIWILAQLALLGLGMLGLLWRRDREWALLLSVLLLLATGHVLQLLSPDREVHMAGWERLAQLIAFPLLATAVYRRVLGTLSWRAHELEEASQDSLSRIAGLIDLLESGQRTSTSLDMAEVLARAVREVVRLLRVDICGLIFPVDGARSRANLAAVYDRQSRGVANVVTFGLAEHPALEHAIKRKKQVVIDTTVNHAQVKGLYVLMGSVEVGPLLIQPLLHNSTAIGALLVGNPSSARRFTSNQQKLCQALSRQVTAAIENARRYQFSQSELEALKTQLQERKEGHQRIIAALQAQLQQAKEDATLFARRLDETTTHVKRERENAESLAQQLQKSEAERTYIEAEMNRARQAINSLQQRLQAQRTEASGDGTALETQAVLHELPESGDTRQARDRFLGALTQELRTPMTSISGYTDLLLGETVGVLGEMQRKFLQRIKANIERMGAMLNDLIGVAAIDGGQLHLEPEFIDVRDAIQEAVASVQGQVEEKGLSLTLELGPDLETIEVDPDAFRQIVGNLLSNACKASPADSSIRIQANRKVEDHVTEMARLVVSVTDSGGGIAPPDQPHVFDRFYRAEEALIPGLGETGVGLSIVKALVEAHHGQVWVESEVGRGSTFVFALPISASRPDESVGNKVLPPLGG